MISKRRSPLAWCAVLLLVVSAALTALIAGRNVNSATSKDSERYSPTTSLVPQGSGYTFRRTITIDHTKVPNTDQSNFPLLISGSYSYLATTANGGNVQNSNGYDVIFTSDTGCSTKLDHEVESYNAITGAVNYWVRVPSVSHSNDTTLYLCYGNAAISTSQENRTGVWDANFRGVWHLGNGSTLSANDSTSNANNGMINGATATAGQIGGSASFSGSSQNITTPASIKLDDAFTLSAWINLDDVTHNSYVIFGFGFNNTDNYGFLIQRADHSGLTVQSTNQGFPPGASFTTPSQNVSAATWTYVVLKKPAGSTVRILQNGTEITNEAMRDTGYLASTLTIGSAVGANYFKGKIDEARFSTIERSPDWIKTEYNNQSSPATFYSISAACSGGTPCHPFFNTKAACLDPRALVALNWDTYPLGPSTANAGSFDLTIGSTPQYLLASYLTVIGSFGGLGQFQTGLSEMRNPDREPLPLRNVHLRGTQSDSMSIFCDPTKVSYANGWQTYYDRLDRLSQLNTKVVHLDTAGQHKMLLPGPYGSFLLHAEAYNTTWIIAGPGGGIGGWNLYNELGDDNTRTQRYSNRLQMPVTQSFITNVGIGLDVSTSGYAGQGSVVYVDLPSDWSADPNTYVFKDDFMGASLNTTTVWTRGPLTPAGNVEIDSAFPWVKAIGNGLLWVNGAFTQQSFTRSAGNKFVMDIVAGDYNASGYGEFLAGLMDGGGVDISNCVHCFYFQPPPDQRIHIIENGTERGAGVQYVKAWAYRIRIHVNNDGSADYELQGGQFAPGVGRGGSTDATGVNEPVGGNSVIWLRATPNVTHSNTNTFRFGFSVKGAQTVWFGYPRVL